ncbi:MAG: bifunctional diaminohydroxyphosphoribosylaminopyrimidine deaminase/5-amino-6-(5-phosphoribosylamino)uracil reductase RibD [Bacteroidales bacterium]|nr:bifunctional diaminohydroxyphosphoribosylaminopyrimidine deaminase/5-amino-6-(5-phosphoribosylamino)uracil reductase RibD [Bacteroidales bacterium]MCF8389108.1 bifunctional diaminohydroxyphosphoribosylaminopyrimidine deaminase/5-amino-6-(5-phosphoribosylamino)uracil reductase RibD [Bacteroidales bacterium]
METITSDVKYMRRCLELARKAKGKTGINPLVGCVIVHKDRIIGEGYHESFGGPHAEVNAISSVKNQNLLSESTLYVNLEPCSHYGKTPPCSLLIRKMKIPCVVIGVIDPNPKVSGNGVAGLEEAGINVITGVLEKESIELNRKFFTNILKKRPYIILKWAESKDGFIDKIRDQNSPIEPTWITNTTARKLVHKWRGEEDAIFTGVNTVLMDDPALNLRDWSGNQPVRISIDRHNRISPNAKIKNGKQETIIFSYQKTSSDTFNQEMPGEFSISDMLDFLYKKQIASVIVEGGAKIINSFIRDGLWDEARVFKGKSVFGNGIISPVITFPPNERIPYCNSLLLITYNRINWQKNI